MLLEEINKVKETEEAEQELQKRLLIEENYLLRERHQLLLKIQEAEFLGAQKRKKTEEKNDEIFEEYMQHKLQQQKNKMDKIIQKLEVKPRQFIRRMVKTSKRKILHLKPA